MEDVTVYVYTITMHSDDITNVQNYQAENDKQESAILIMRATVLILIIISIEGYTKLKKNCKTYHFLNTILVP